MSTNRSEKNLQPFRNSPVNPEPDANRVQHIFPEGLHKSLPPDVEVVTRGGRVVKCHSLYLASFSPVLKRQLYGSSDRDPTRYDPIYLPDIAKEDFEILLHYMHTGLLRVSCNNYLGVYQAASELKMHDVIRMCLKLVDGDNDIRSFYYIYVASKKLGAEEYWRRSLGHLTYRFEEAVCAEEFLQLDVDNVIELLSADSIGARSETIVYLAALNWLDADFATRRKHAVQVMQCIRFSAMTLDEINACHHPPFLYELLAIPEIVTILYRAKCYIKAKLTGEESKFQNYANRKRNLAFEHLPMELWNDTGPSNPVIDLADDNKEVIRPLNSHRKESRGFQNISDLGEIRNHACSRNSHPSCSSNSVSSEPNGNVFETHSAYSKDSKNAHGVYESSSSENFEQDMPFSSPFEVYKSKKVVQNISYPNYEETKIRMESEARPPQLPSQDEQLSPHYKNSVYQKTDEEFSTHSTEAAKNNDSDQRKDSGIRFFNRENHPNSSESQSDSFDEAKKSKSSLQDLPKRNSSPKNVYTKTDSGEKSSPSEFSKERESSLSSSTFFNGSREDPKDKAPQRSSLYEIPKENRLSQSQKTEEILEENRSRSSDLIFLNNSREDLEDAATLLTDSDEENGVFRNQSGTDNNSPLLFMNNSSESEEADKKSRRSPFNKSKSSKWYEVESLINQRKRKKAEQASKWYEAESLLNQKRRLAEQRRRSTNIYLAPETVLVQRKTQTPYILLVGGMNPLSMQTAGIGGAVLNFIPSKNKWVRYNSLPEARCYHSIAYCNHQLYVIGGCDPMENQMRHRATKTCFRLHTQLQEWERIDPMKYRRSDHAVALLGRYIFVIGGQDDGERLLKNMEVYDTHQEVWKLLSAEMCCGRRAMGAVGFKNRVWVAGGLTQLEKDIGLQIVSHVDCYDPLEKKWFFSVNLLPTPRVYHSLTVWNGVICCVGGMTQISVSDTHLTDEVLFMDDSSKTWSAGPSLPFPRLGAGAIVFDNILYVVGGYNPEAVQHTKNVYYLTQTAETWERAAALPAQLFGCSAVSAAH